MFLNSFNLLLLGFGHWFCQWFSHEKYLLTKSNNEKSNDGKPYLHDLEKFCSKSQLLVDCLFLHRRKWVPFLAIKVTGKGVVSEKQICSIRLYPRNREVELNIHRLRSNIFFAITFLQYEYPTISTITMALLLWFLVFRKFVWLETFLLL